MTGSQRLAGMITTGAMTACAMIALLAGTAQAAAGDQPVATPVVERVFPLDNPLPRRAGGVQPRPEAQPLTVGAVPVARRLGDLVETDRQNVPAQLPAGDFTVELWLLDHVNQPVGTLIGTDSTASDGWVLGYRSGQAMFGPLAAGQATPSAQAPVGEGFKEFWHHLVGVREGREWRLYVNGALAAQTTADAPSAAVASLDLTGYFAAERFMHLPDLVKANATYDHALDQAEIAAVFARRTALVEQGILAPGELHFTQPPYLNSPTTSSMELSWETDRPAAARVEWGETAESLQQRSFPANGQRLGGMQLDGLKADTPYFYRVVVRDDAGGERDSGLLSFRTAPEPGMPFTIAISGDTEARTHINSRMSALIWEERPSLFMLAGDLTDGGSAENRFQWTHEYFAGMGPLFGRVPVVAAPGNGEEELQWFRHYHRQPGDEAFFSLPYGDAEIFVLDSNLEDREEREPGFRARQRVWLEQALARSTAKWKIAIHHHALMSTDDDDYGDSWTGKSTASDPEAIADFQSLYEKYNVDLVIQGHLHTYERSWPIRDGQIDPARGVTYVQVGGMGGNLEDFQPTKPWFNRKNFRDHHFLMLRGAGDRLEAEVIDADGRLRDSFTLSSR
ncbi:metallophosphoesterase [Croceibacterium xixiisoli]